MARASGPRAGSVKPTDSSISVHRNWLLIELRTDWDRGTEQFAAGSLLAADYDRAWLTSPHCLAGGALFGLGMAINLKADTMLIRLRADGAGGYRIPRGFLFERVSSPNLFGEMLEWAGFALMAWNLAALSFAVWTVANLLPRAKHHHDWYHARFPDYPPQRKVVFPYLY